MDNLTEAERKRGQLTEQIQSLYKSGISIREITRITGKNRNTVRKYLHGDPDLLCRSNVRSSRLQKNWRSLDMPGPLQMPGHLSAKWLLQMIWRSESTVMVPPNTTMMEAKKWISIT